MPVYTIRHSPALHGEAQINTSKNAVLPILAAALLCSSPVTIHRAPRLTDVDHMLRVLTDCGARIERQDRDITIYPGRLRHWPASGGYPPERPARDGRGNRAGG